MAAKKPVAKFAVLCAAAIALAILSATGVIKTKTPSKDASPAETVQTSGETAQSADGTAGRCVPTPPQQNAGAKVSAPQAKSRVEETRPVPAGTYHGTGTVIKLLPDDLEPPCHQRFLLKLPGGDTLLVVHNIDLAPRLNAIHTGDKVEFCGEYIDNDKGGLVHWTHHDPRGRHKAGWLKHNGKIYE